MRGLAGYKEARQQRWRYYSLKGARLPRPLQDPEGHSPRAQAAREAVRTLLAHSTWASTTSSPWPEARPSSRAATAARSPTTAACTCGRGPG